MIIYECLLVSSSSRHHAPACVVLVSDCCLLATDDMMILLLLNTQGFCDGVPMMSSNICTFFVFFFASLQHTLSLSHFHAPLSLSILTDLLAGQGIAPSVMAPLPKRAALEKANGASAVFNTGMLQYQQALASMQFQQQAAFLPSGMASKASTVSALTTQRMPGAV